MFLETKNNFKLNCIRVETKEKLQFNAILDSK